jgi:hypothetical protein
MKRFILDTGIAALQLDRKRGVFERASAEVTKGNRVGIAAPVLAELAFRAEGSPQRDRNILRLRQALSTRREDDHFPRATDYSPDPPLDYSQRIGLNQKNNGRSKPERRSKSKRTACNENNIQAFMPR